MKLFVLLITLFLFTSFRYKSSEPFLFYAVNPKTVTIRTFGKDHKVEKLKSIPALKQYVEASGRKLVFAMNCGMYMEDYSPVGLYIEEASKFGDKTV